MKKLVILNNNYKIKKILDIYGEELNITWNYAGVEKIMISEKHSPDDIKKEYIFYVVKFKSDSIHDLFIYTTNSWLGDIYISCSIPTMLQAKEKLDNIDFDFVDMDKAIGDSRYDFRDELEIVINTYDEDTIEQNFYEDNGREMEDEDWEDYRKLYNITWKYIINKIEAIIGQHDEDGIDEFEMDCFNWRGFDNEDISKIEAVADALHGHVLDSDTIDPIYNQVILYERDWLGEALESNGIKWEDCKIANMVQSIAVRIPKGNPLYYMVGGQ